MTYDLLFKSGSIVEDVPEEFVFKAFSIPEVLEVRYHITKNAIWQRHGMTAVEIIDNTNSLETTYFDNSSEALEFAEKYANHAKRFYDRWGEPNFKQVIVLYHGHTIWSWKLDDDSKEEVDF